MNAKITFIIYFSKIFSLILHKGAVVHNFSACMCDMNTDNFTIGVVISTYNNPEWLEKTLWSYLFQTRRPDEIIIADDGSDHHTRELIDSFRDRLPIKHVWHEDNGFRKSQILNKALVAAVSDYLIFTDQDCVARPDFVEVHARSARPGYFVSGGYFKLPLDLSKDIAYEDVESTRAFSLSWLRSHGLKLNWKCTKLLRSGAFASLMNNITPARSSWNGCNSSGWREDMLRVNGYNEDMQYGGQDREFGERLVNLGIRSIQKRYSAIVLHLDHKRPYRTRESIEKNRAIRRHTCEARIIRTPHGIEKLS